MTWALDTSTQGTPDTTDPHVTSHTCSAATKVLVVAIFFRDTTPRAGGAPTYNAAPMTDSGQGFVAPTENASVELWYLLDPSTGDNNISVPNTNLVTMNVSAMSFEPSVGNNAVFDNSNSATGTSTGPTVTVTNTYANDLMVGVLGSGDRDVPSAGANYILAHTEDAGNQVWGTEYDLDSGASGGVVVDFTTPHNEDYALIGISFNEVADAARRIFITHV